MTEKMVQKARREREDLAELLLLAKQLNVEAMVWVQRVLRNENSPPPRHLYDPRRWEARRVQADHMAKAICFLNRVEEMEPEMLSPAIRVKITVGRDWLIAWHNDLASAPSAIIEPIPLPDNLVRPEEPKDSGQIDLVHSIDWALAKIEWGTRPSLVYDNLVTELQDQLLNLAVESDGDADRLLQEVTVWWDHVPETYQLFPTALMDNPPVEGDDD